MNHEHNHPQPRQRWMSKAMVVKITGATLLLIAGFVLISYYTGLGQTPVIAPSTTVTAP